MKKVNETYKKQHVNNVHDALKGNIVIGKVYDNPHPCERKGSKTLFH